MNRYEILHEHYTRLYPGLSEQELSELIDYHFETGHSP